MDLDPPFLSVYGVEINVRLHNYNNNTKIFIIIPGTAYTEGTGERYEVGVCAASRTGGPRPHTWAGDTQVGTLKPYITD